MKIAKELPAVPAIRADERRQPVLPEAAEPQARRTTGKAVSRRVEAKQGAGFNIQLNRQLSSMQQAERYLGDVESQLVAMKMRLSRALSTAEPSEATAIKESLQQLRSLISERLHRAGGAVDARLKLSLNEPARVRYRLQGLESVEAIRQSGRETLLFTAGRQWPEPVAVVLDDGMSDQQILRRFNTSLGQVGIRAELDEAGDLRFSAREQEWEAVKHQLAVQGEGKLFAKEGFQQVRSQEELWLSLPDELQLDTRRDLRRVLDQVVSGLDKVIALREQLAVRQQEIREFLARHASEDERAWARDYATSVLSVMTRQPTTYSGLAQIIMAQANVGRFTVVSLLS